MICIPLLGLSALLSAYAVSPCLDETSTEFTCQVDSTGILGLASCEITDEDVGSGDLASCLDTAGRGNITDLSLTFNNLTTLPEGLFQDLTNLTVLNLENNSITTLPGVIFQNLTSLAKMTLGSNNLTSLPDGIFEDLSALDSLYLSFNNLTNLPEGICEDLTALTRLYLDSNAFIMLPQDIFQSCTALTKLYLANNALTTLPEGIFESLRDLNYLRLNGNSLECLPNTDLEEVDDDASYWDLGVHVDEYGDECGCSIANVTDNVCGEETCSPGAFGYTCASSTTAPTPAPSLSISPTTAPALVAASTAPTPALSFNISPTTAPALAAPSAAPTPALPLNISPTTAPVLAALSTAPTPAPYLNSSSTAEPATTPEEQQSVSAATPVVVGVITAVAGLVLVALVVRLRRRQASKQGILPSGLRPAHDDDNLERGRDEPREVPSPSYAAVRALGNAGDKPHSRLDVSSRDRYAPAEADAVDDRGIVSPSILVSRDKRVQSSTQCAENAAGGCGAGLAGGDVARTSVEKLSTAAASASSAFAADLSATERAEPAQSHQRQSAVGELGPTQASTTVSGVSSTPNRNRAVDELGLGHAVLAAAQELVHHCQTPGISEAATAVCIMARLVTDGRDSDRASEARLRQCGSIVVALNRATEVVDRGGDTMGEAARVLIEDVHEAIVDLVDLIRTFQSKHTLSKAFMSTLFKRRQDELDAVVDRAILRLQLGLQLQVGHDVKAVKDGVDILKDDVSAVKETIQLCKRTNAEAKSESVAEVRSMRRQRKLDQVEIPEDHLFITGDLLGKGGFGEVYLADYNGHNAAAKVLKFAHGLGALEQDQKEQETSQRRAFLRELEAMIRLRSPNTVNVYGAVTSLPDRMVLVMELLVGGDLLTLLRKSAEPLPEEQSRRIIGDICTGMAFLHSKNTVHGDLKSANVLLDSNGRSKIADFGTSKWSHHTNSTGLATYATISSRSTQMSIAWSAPEVLDSGGSTYKSDVYSFGIVIWEVFSRERPWANKMRPTEILTAVLQGGRPLFGIDVPADIVDIAKACWSGEPEERTTFRAILEGMKAKGWSDGQAKRHAH